MLACHGCHRHVRIDESHCPFCGTALASTPAPSVGLTAALVATLGLTTVACATRPVDEGADSGTTTMGTTTEMTTDMTTATSTETGETEEATTEEWQEEEEASAYAGPAEWEEEAEFEAGDGDGDGDGDVGPVPCGDFAIGPVAVGSNELVIIDSPSLLQASCGSDGPEAVHEFIAPQDGLYTFEVTDADFPDWALYLAGESCEPLDELACEINGQVQQDLLAGQAIYVVADLPAGSAGMGNLEITGP